MAETNIEWSKYTHNEWTGCTKVSPACDNCYAESWSKRSGHVTWGAGNPRRLTTEANRRKPFKWNEEARKAGRIDTVFCNSLSDWADKEVPQAWRDGLLSTVRQTPNLEWLMLTKRHRLALDYLPTKPLPNVRVGMTVENDDFAKLRLPCLARLGHRGWKTFVSYEPALGPVDWWHWLNPKGNFAGYIQWIISGGESGHHARISHPDWFRSARDACARAGVPYLHKQNGEWAPVEHLSSEEMEHLELVGKYEHFDDTHMVRVGKAASGRKLDGVIHDAFPEVA